ncbi:MAG TPA: hypothetical protein ENJ09_09695 [Planctomycetes bacterium]|nr:hypothetical protein [Planctomycetota bacterium]
MLSKFLLPPLVLSLFFLPACSGGGSGGSVGGSVAIQTGTLAGRVVDSTATPVSGATVHVCEPGGAQLASLTTRADGRFSFEVKATLLDLAVDLFGIPSYQTTVFVAPDVETDLGDVSIDDVALDTDGDGLPNSLERRGWTILVDETGDDVLVQRKVFSNPLLADTDGDGLDDAVEFASRIDPGLTDTDRDQLTDPDELKRYKSNPADVDTDGDARGPGLTSQPNPSLLDGNEILLSGTSPTLDDTDGDGLTDYEEIIGGGFNPLEADLPQISLDLNGDPSITLNAEKTQTQQQVTASSTLQRDSNQTTQTDSRSTQVSVEASQKINQSVQTQAFPPKAKAKTDVELQFKESLTQNTSSSWSQTSTQETQNTYSQNFETGEQITFKDGALLQALKLRNLSSRSVLIQDVNVLAFRLNPITTGSFEVVGTLQPTPGDIPAGGAIVAPGGEIGFVAQNDEINWQAIQPLMKDPSALFFEVGSFSMFETDDFGNPTKNFAATGQKIVERCGLVVIDFGDGRVERHTLATNVERNPDGSSAGISMREGVERVAGVPLTTVVDPDTGASVLWSVRDQVAYEDPNNKAIHGFWTVMGDGPAFDDNAVLDFDSLRLANGERFALVFLQDADGDGLFNREERTYGTDSNLQDSDGDGLTDKEEAKDGWAVEFRDPQGTVLPQFTYQSYPDPVFTDTDSDNLDDFEEKVLGTDPREADTDGDGLNDDVDPSPLDPPDGSGIPSAGLVAHFEFGSATVTTGASSFMFYTDASGSGNDALIDAYAGGTWGGSGTQGWYDLADRFGISDKAAYVFQRTDNGNPAQHLEIPAITLGDSLSWAVWVDQASSGTYIARQGGPDLGLNSGIVEWQVPISGLGTQMVTGALGQAGWNFVVGVVDTNGQGTTIRLYVNGILANSASFGSAFVPDDTKLISVAARTKGSGFLDDYKGPMDSVRIYRRVLTDTDVDVLYHEAGF